MTRLPKRRLLLMALIVAAFALLFTGCKVTGGGSIAHGTFYGTSQNYPPVGKKATFGFVWQTNDNHDYLASGAWTDGAVRFRLDGGEVMTWTDGQDGIGSAYGTYVSTNKTYPGHGDVTLCLVDNGEPGPSNGDELTIDIDGGPYNGYTATGVLQGGNLQIKQ